ncbi:MAG: hypothetical protein AAFN92_00120 [Bacteroidota bacterium]
MTLTAHYCFTWGIALTLFLGSGTVCAQTVRAADLPEYTDILLDNGILNEAGVEALTRSLTDENYLIPTRGRSAFSPSAAPDSIFAVRIMAELAAIYQREFLVRSGMLAAAAFMDKHGKRNSDEMSESERAVMWDSIRNTPGFRTELALGVDPLDTTTIRREGSWVGYPPSLPSGEIPLLVGKNVSIFGKHSLRTLETLAAIQLIPAAAIRYYSGDFAAQGPLPLHVVFKELSEQMGDALVRSTRRRERIALAENLRNEGFLGMVQYRTLLASDSILDAPYHDVLYPFLKGFVSLPIAATANSLGEYRTVLTALCRLDSSFCAVTASATVLDTVLEGADTLLRVEVCLTGPERQVCGTRRGWRTGLSQPNHFNWIEDDGWPLLAQWQAARKEEPRVYGSRDPYPAAEYFLHVTLMNQVDAERLVRLGEGKLRLEGPGFD